MSTITQRLKVKLRKLRGKKVEDHEQQTRPDLIYEGFDEVIAERDSLRDQLSEANRKIAELENMARAFQAQDSLNHQVSDGKKEEDDGKDKEIERLEGELGMKAKENQRLKSQLDRKGKEFTKLRNNIRSAYTNMENAVATLGSAFIFTVKSPPKNGNDFNYDLIGAMPSAGDDMWFNYLSDGDDK